MKTAALLLAIPLALGCGGAKPEPELASSAPHAGYAETYPASVQAVTQDIGTDQLQVKAAVQNFPRYPDELKAPNYTHVLEVVQRADEEGKSYAYVDRVREIQGAKEFFDAEKDEITKKVSGSAQYVAKQKGCDVDVSGAVAHALKESVDKQMEKRLREASEAHRLIDRYREELGKENAEKLEHQADEITFASYQAHVDLVEKKLMLRRMVEEAETIKKTADDDIQAERKYQAEPKRTDAEKKAAEERIAAMNKSKAMIDSAVTQAKAASEGLDERIAEVQKVYEDGIAQLKKTLEGRAGGK